MREGVVWVTVAELIAEETRVRELALATDFTGWSGQDLAVYLQHSQAGLASGLAVQLRAVAAFDAAGCARQLQYRTTASFLRDQLRLTGPQAESMVHTARALRDELPATEAALAQGVISGEHVQAIRRGHRRLGDDYAACEALVAEYAATSTSTDVRVFIDELIDQVDPADPERDEAERDKRYVHLSQTMGGWWRLDGLLDPAAGEKLSAALTIFSERSGQDDVRDPKQRRCDGLAEIADRALALVDRTAGGSAVTITITVEQLHDGRGCAGRKGCG